LSRFSPAQRADEPADRYFAAMPRVANKIGFRELVDFDQLGGQYPYVAISTGV